ncbi:OLC1v1031307C1 [Oldenlandia corymbosa var. corymbosa]|uniref:OLC1v1031307C1 n=1 Tax=Oldenlandia corymbosa var. corymbosa TaxID=529605 RepID=A0AAV1CL18_OLDCO|nr:OLC1v1031307C1 [Oldenlandia corymbosa var. corymbosa]
MYKLPKLQEFSFPVNKINGSLSSEIASLNKLRVLSLHSNELTGVIPPEIGKLSNLELLLLNSNNLNGVLPLPLSNCTKLTVLTLRGNFLTGDLSLFDFSKFVKLRMIDFGNNAFYGTLPATLFACKSLIAVRLAMNHLNGEIPQNIQELESLSFLSLSNNSLTNVNAAIRILSRCRSLSIVLLSLNFYDDAMQGDDDDNFIDSKGFQNLQVFGLGGCHISGHIPGWLAKLRKLKVLDLSHNHLTGSIPSFFGSLPNLFYLDLSQNSLSGNFPVELTRMPRLGSKAIDEVDQTSLHLPVFVKLENTSNMQYTQISSLPPTPYLRSNNLSGNIPVEISRLKFIHNLDLSDNLFSGSIPNTFSY